MAEEKVEKERESGSFMMKLAAMIVDKRKLIFLIVIIGLIFSAFSRNWVEVENDLTYYLPADSETKQALNLMEEEFTTYGSADIMVSSVTYEEAEALEKKIAAMDGVLNVQFDETSDHYNNISALYSITFETTEDDEESLTSLNHVKEALSAYDIYVKTQLGNAKKDIIDSEVAKIMVYVAIIVVIVLIFTSETYAEVPVLLITFVTAMILNAGTNFLLGKISFVSNSVTSILQLALSLDYAVIFCNRFKEEHKNLEVREAVIVALSKAIPEIGASSLTTVGGLVAMLFMNFKLGPDMGICLIKAILFALLSVFVVMPGLLVLFGPLMDKTAHKVYVPKIPFVGEFDWKVRKIVPVLFAVLVLFAYHFSSLCPYAYGYGNLTTPKLNDVQIAENMIKDNFTSNNMVALIVPSGNYDKERELISKLEACEEVDHTQGLASIDALGGYKLADSLNPRQFSELAGIDYEAAELLYGAYAAENEEYSKLLGSLSSYSVPLIDIFLFACDAIHDGYVTLDQDTLDTLESAYDQMNMAKNQLQGENYSRILVYLNLPEGGDETYAFLDTMKETAESVYKDGNILLAGNSTNEYDFKKAFSRDNVVVGVMSILIVLVVLLFTFNSVGMPLLLIAVIQGSIYINFAIPYFTNTGLFFLSYLVVSSIQMGANIDYAIVIASRYMELKETMDRREAIIETLNFAFPTIITSGSILAASGILIGQMTSEAAICGIGQSLGRGTIISIILVMFVLPEILLIGGGIIDKTSFKVPKVERKMEGHGTIRVDGMVNGEVNGRINGVVHAFIQGDANLNVVSGSAAEEKGDEGNESKEAEDNE